MSLARRMRHKLRLVRETMPVAVHPWRSALFFLLPQRACARVWPFCRLRHRGVQFVARHNDWGSVKHVLLGSEYDFVPGLLKGQLQPTIVDIGASIGVFALYVFGRYPSAVIHSVEPSLQAYETLELNRRSNPHLSWHSYNLAAWSSEGRVPFHTDAAVPTLSSVRVDGTETVAAITLTQFLADHVRATVDLLKMDIEGAEEEVLCSSEPALKQVRQMVVQVHPARMNADRVKAVLLSTFGFVYLVPGDRRNPLLLATRAPQQRPLEAL